MRIRLRVSWVLAGTVVLAGVATGLALPAPPLVVSPGGSRLLPAGAVLTIAGNNLSIGVRLLLGAVSCGVYSALQLFACGLVGGLAANRAMAGGMPGMKVALLLAPHGLVELGGFVILGSLGFQTGWLAWRALRGDAAMPFGAIWQSGARQAVAGLFLIVIASLIEVFLTPRIAMNL